MGFKSELIPSLLDLGLTELEARLYLHLLRVKSAGARQIHDSREFRELRRPNLYKLLASLEEKRFVTEEIKDGKKLFFPVEPHAITTAIRNERMRTFEEWEKEINILKEDLEVILDTPYDGFHEIADPYIDLITELVDEKWILKEEPLIEERKLLGSILSLEFNTRRRFAANAAGIIIHHFRYPEHRIGALPLIRDHMISEMRISIESVKEQGPFAIKKFWFENAVIDHPKLPGSFPYIQTQARLFIPGKHHGGIAIFLLRDYPNDVFAIWGADHRDFLDLVERMGNRFEIQPLPEDLFPMKFSP